MFAATHAEIRRWFDDGRVDGLRVDHPDGLRDPARLPRRLAELTGRRLGAGREDPRARRGAAAVGGRRHHRLRRARAVDRVLIDPAAEDRFTALETGSPGAHVAGRR